MKVSAITLALFFALGSTLAVAQGGGAGGGGARAEVPLAEGARPQLLANPVALPT